MGRGASPLSEQPIHVMAGEMTKGLVQLGSSLAERATPFVLQTAVSSMAYSAGLAATQVRICRRGERWASHFSAQERLMRAAPLAPGVRICASHLVRHEISRAGRRVLRGDGRFSGRWAGVGSDDTLEKRR